MASYEIRFKTAARKDLRRVPAKTLSRIVEAIKELGSNPFPSDAVKLVDADRLYRIRVGDYRVIYEVETEPRTVVVHHVRHRSEVYRSL